MIEPTPDPSVFNAKSFLKTVSTKPGVYRMLNGDGAVIYVGKAKNLRNRVSSYFSGAHNAKTLTLVSQIRDIETTVTRSEAEALLLEDTLIKKYQPRYNVLLRDDKSYPYIRISTRHRSPGIFFYRGQKRKGDTYFGPFTSSGAVRETLNMLYRVFRLRQCKDSYFDNRSRPCLQYQIKRCSAPCVGMISAQDYDRDVSHAVLLLKGKTDELIHQLVSEMEQASKQLEFEKAAQIRDQISYLRVVLEKQYVSGQKEGKVDVIACSIRDRQCCIQVFYYRNGANQGNKAFYPRLPDSDTDPAQVLEAFISQHYLTQEIPSEIITSDEPATRTFLEAALSERAGKKIRIKSKVRLERARWLENAVQNAEEVLSLRLASRSNYRKRLLDLQGVFNLDNLPGRIECFDISHTQGKETVGSCVVFNDQGPLKSDYRRFNIKNITPGDDYAAMSQVLERRYSRVLKEEGALPDIVLIDGGKGQLGKAVDIMFSLMKDVPLLVGVSKGPDRRAGQEVLHIDGLADPMLLSSDSPALLLIQQIRDEAHRFAITGHRQRARKKVKTSSLEEIEGLGPKRRQILLKYFGGLQGIKNAGVEDLAGIQGISKRLAKRIYASFHS
jgi:excinuclease ABC subunit C